MEDLKTLHDQALGAAAPGPPGGREQRDAPPAEAGRAHQAAQPARAGQDAGDRGPVAGVDVARSPRPGNTPSLDEVRDKIERRYANAMGRAELAGNSVEGRMLEIQKSTLDLAGSSRLEQIRASMAGDQLAPARPQPAVEQASTGGDSAGVARLDQIRASLANKEKSTGDASAAGLAGSLQ